MKRLLFVEDDRNLCLLYEAEFRRAGYDVETVAEGDAALGVIAARPPDLVVLDLKLDPTDGLDILEEIRARWRNLPVVINTAYPYFKNDFGSWSADAFVVKSGDLAELARTVREVLAP